MCTANPAGVKVYIRTTKRRFYTPLVEHVRYYEQTEKSAVVEHTLLPTHNDLLQNRFFVSSIIHETHKQENFDEALKISSIGLPVSLKSKKKT